MPPSSHHNSILEKLFGHKGESDKPTAEDIEYDLKDRHEGEKDYGIDYETSENEEVEDWLGVERKGSKKSSSEKEEDEDDDDDDRSGGVMMPVF